MQIRLCLPETKTEDLVNVDYYMAAKYQYAEQSAFWTLTRLV